MVLHALSGHILVRLRTPGSVKHDTVTLQYLSEGAGTVGITAESQNIGPYASEITGIELRATKYTSGLRNLFPKDFFARRRTF
jgi:hypothetical protein